MKNATAQNSKSNVLKQVIGNQMFRTPAKLKHLMVSWIASPLYKWQCGL